MTMSSVLSFILCKFCARPRRVDPNWDMSRAQSARAQLISHLKPGNIVVSDGAKKSHFYWRFLCVRDVAFDVDVNQETPLHEAQIGVSKVPPGLRSPASLQSRQGTNPFWGSIHRIGLKQHGRSAKGWRYGRCWIWAPLDKIRNGGYTRRCSKKSSSPIEVKSPAA